MSPVFPKASDKEPGAEPAQVGGSGPVAVGYHGGARVAPKAPPAVALGGVGPAAARGGCGVHPAFGWRCVALFLSNI